MTKKCELVAEFLSSLGPQVAGEIPPFGFETGMTAVIGGKLIVPPRQRHSPIGMCPRHDEEQTQEAEQSWKIHRERRDNIRSA
jgi:hypothetical protein